ncbi:hypothetical protein DM02DRAFT_660010, partial [Periconia macrospinosa]
MNFVDFLDFLIVIFALFLGFCLYEEYGTPQKFWARLLHLYHLREAMTSHDPPPEVPISLDKKELTCSNDEACNGSPTTCNSAQPTAVDSFADGHPQRKARQPSPPNGVNGSGDKAVRINRAQRPAINPAAFELLQKQPPAKFDSNAYGLARRKAQQSASKDVKASNGKPATSNTDRLPSVNLPVPAIASIPPHLRYKQQPASKVDTASSDKPVTGNSAHNPSINPASCAAVSIPPHLRNKQQPASKEVKAPSDNSAGLPSIHPPVPESAYTPPHLRYKQQPASKVDTASSDKPVTSTSAQRPATSGPSADGQLQRKTRESSPKGEKSSSSSGKSIVGNHSLQPSINPPVPESAYIPPHRRYKQQQPTSNSDKPPTDNSTVEKEKTSDDDKASNGKSTAGASYLCPVYPPSHSSSSVKLTAGDSGLPSVGPTPHVDKTSTARGDNASSVKSTTSDSPPRLEANTPAYGSHKASLPTSNDKEVSSTNNTITVDTSL